jgi:hypothetical protein
MKRWIALAAALYPRSWREEYGLEFDALLNEVGPSGRVFINVLGGAVRMQIKTQRDWLKLLATTAALGAIVSAGLSLTVAPSYVSSATIGVTPQPDPVRPASPQTLRQRAAADFARMKAWTLSRHNLAVIINDPRLNLYREERRRFPIDDVEDLMRRNMRIELRPSTPMVVQISFAYPDRAKAQATVGALASGISQETALANREREATYKSLWQDMAALHLAKPAPPPPMGEIVAILDPPSLPKESNGPNILAFVGWGLGAGLLAGCILAAAASFLLPNRYTATAVTEIVPAKATEDPLAPPSSTNAAEFLRRNEGRAISSENLSWIILRWGQHSHGPLAQKSIEDVVREIRAGIRIAPLNSDTAAFSISWSGSDRREVQDVVNLVISGFIQESISEQRAHAVNATQREILARRAGEYLDTLDPPTAHFSQDSPNRLTIAAAGFAIGLLVGALSLRPRRRAGLTPQTA